MSAVFGVLVSSNLTVDVNNIFVGSESIITGEAPPIDVYDAVSMSVISPLSEKSIARGSTSVKFPDFTRRKWKKNKPIFALSDEY